MAMLFLYYLNIITTSYSLFIDKNFQRSALLSMQLSNTAVCLPDGITGYFRDGTKLAQMAIDFPEGPLFRKVSCVVNTHSLKHAVPAVDLRVLQYLTLKLKSSGKHKTASNKLQLISSPIQGDIVLTKLGYVTT